MDAGNLYWKSARLTPEELPGQKEKARLMAEAVTRGGPGGGGVDAMLLAEGDLAVGLDHVRALASEFALPYVTTNLDCGDGLPARDRLIERDGMRIGVLGVVNDRGVFPGCTASDPQAAVRAGVERLRAQGAAVVVLLDALPDEASDGLARAVPGVDLVVGGTSQPLQSPTPLPGGGLRLGAGTRGRTVGSLSFTLREGARVWREDRTLGRLADQRDGFQRKVDDARVQQSRAPGENERIVAQRRAEYYQKQVDDVAAQLALASGDGAPSHTAHNTLVTLDTTVADDPAVQALVDAAKKRVMEATVKALVGKPIVGPYVGNQVCATCHEGPTQQWRSTPHASAYASLIHKERQYDAACYACHVTGAVPAPTGGVLGPTSPTAVGALVNVGCESCHGPGNLHVRDPSVAMPMPAEQTCTTCHDAEQDGGRFDYGAYLPRVVHGLTKPE